MASNSYIPTAPATAQPVIWSYLDYRKYLKSVYEHKKRETAGRFSYRLFSIKTGVASPNYLKLIVDGSRNLTYPHAKRVASFCGLSLQERDYFLALTRWNQSKKQDEKEALWANVLRKRSEVKGLELSTAQLAILTQSHTVAIFELLRVDPSLKNAEDIAKQMRAGVTKEEVEESLHQLVLAKVIKKVDDGYKVLQESIRTTEDVPSAGIRQFHKQVIEKALSAIETVPVSEREYISSTIAIKKSDLPKLKEHLREMRNLILSEAENTVSPEEVYQLNIQLFPLTINKKDRS